MGNPMDEAVMNFITNYLNTDPSCYYKRLCLATVLVRNKAKGKGPNSEEVKELEELQRRKEAIEKDYGRSFSALDEIVYKNAANPTKFIMLPHPQSNHRYRTRTITETADLLASVVSYADELVSKRLVL